MVLALGCASLNMQTYMLETPICSVASHAPAHQAKREGSPKTARGTVGLDGAAAAVVTPD